jgi:peptidoglycan hydrolase-like protein with peptidoglycan-binding domain
MDLIVISGSVGEGGANRESDVGTIQKRLKEIGKDCGSSDGACGQETIQAIRDFQGHFMKKPDGLIEPGGRSIQFLTSWSVKPISLGVDLRGNLQKAWDLLNPLLPAGSYCSSGYRGSETQRTILHRFYSVTYRNEILKKYGRARYDEIWQKRYAREPEMLAMVKGVGQPIAPPGRSKHQRGKALDIGGPPAIDKEQVNVARTVASANPSIFTGVVLKERNGCVHVEIH